MCHLLKRFNNYAYSIFFLVLIWSVVSPLCLGKTVYITPGAWKDLFAINDPILNSDGQREPTYQLKKVLESLGYRVKQVRSLCNVQDVFCIIVFDVPNVLQQKELRKYPKDALFLFLWEPPTTIIKNYESSLHRLFSRVYTWRDDLVDNKQYFKFYYPVFHPMINDVIDFDDKLFCTLIACNKASLHPNELYSERKKAIQFYDGLHPNDFDLYGRGWSSALYKTYQGSIQSKIEVLKRYKFCICYENIQGIAGYVTEKIFDCFWAGCIPIYWGASNIEDYIPSECFIDRRDFSSDEEVYDFIKRISKEEYAVYMKAIKQFLSSKQALLYSTDTFIDMVLEGITSRKAFLSV